MVKKLLKSLSLGVIVFLIAVLCGYISYIITFRYQADKLKDITASEDVSAVSNNDTVPFGDEDIGSVDHYVARLENDKISVYVSSDGKEAFLYSLDIYASDFPKEDIDRLREGVVLKNRQELTSFEEDFTS